MLNPIPQPKPIPPIPDMERHLPAHLSAETRNLIVGRGGNLNESGLLEYREYEIALTTLGRGYIQLVRDRLSGTDRLGLPVFWDAIPTPTGKNEAFALTLMPLPGFRHIVEVQRFCGIRLIRNQIEMTHQDLCADIDLRSEVKTSDESSIADAITISQEARAAMIDRDGIPFRIELTPDSIIESAEIRLTQREEIVFSITRPQLRESYLWTLRCGWVSSHWPVKALTTPDISALSSDDWDIASESTPVGCGSPLEQFEDGTGIACHSIRRPLYMSDIVPLRGFVTALKEWEAIRVRAIGI